MESCGKARIRMRPNRDEEGRILCSMPGRFGDILWALPTVREISEYHGKPVSFVTSPRFRSIVDLIQQQDYIDQAFVDPCWVIENESPITPSEPVSRYDGYDWQYHLGYPEWPTRPLPYYVASYAGWPSANVRLEDPWIRPSIEERNKERVAVGFPDEWIELKMGVLLNLAGEFDKVQFDLIVPDRIGSRIREWVDVLPKNVLILPCSWVCAAHYIATSGLYLGCLSAHWVLANAVGTPTVIFEPSPERHHPIFWVDRYVDGKNQNHLVRGIDGKPTFDARHVINDLDDALTPIWHKEVPDGKTTKPDDR